MKLESNPRPPVEKLSNEALSSKDNIQYHVLGAVTFDSTLPSMLKG